MARRRDPRTQDDVLGVDLRIASADLLWRPDLRGDSQGLQRVRAVAEAFGDLCRTQRQPAGALEVDGDAHLLGKVHVAGV
jgi:hypothetical protein